MDLTSRGCFENILTLEMNQMISFLNHFESIEKGCPMIFKKKKNGFKEETRFSTPDRKMRLAEFV